MKIPRHLKKKSDIRKYILWYQKINLNFLYQKILFFLKFWYRIFDIFDIFDIRNWWFMQKASGSEFCVIYKQKMESSREFLELPNEIIDHILQDRDISYRDICRVSQTCNQMHKLCMSNELWKRKLHQRLVKTCDINLFVNL